MTRILLALIAAVLCVTQAQAGDAKLTLLYSSNNNAEVHACPS